MFRTYYYVGALKKGKFTLYKGKKNLHDAIDTSNHDGYYNRNGYASGGWRCVNARPLCPWGEEMGAKQDHGQKRDIQPAAAGRMFDLRPGCR